MANFLRTRLPAFRNAFSGLVYVLRTQKNAWIHSAATVIAIGLAIVLELPSIQIALIVLVIGLVWAAEIFNTSIEAVVDLISPNHHPLAKIAKDAGAGAVLATAIISVIVGFLLLGPPLIEIFRKLFSR